MRIYEPKEQAHKKSWSIALRQDNDESILLAVDSRTGEGMIRENTEIHGPEVEKS